MTSAEETGRLRELLERTRMSLLDLSRRNRLLNFKEATRDIALDEVDLDAWLQSLDDGRRFKFEPTEVLDEALFEFEPNGRGGRSNRLLTPYTCWLPFKTDPGFPSNSDPGYGCPVYLGVCG